MNASRRWLIGILILPNVACSALEVQGHRGARGMRPENTWPAFEYAIELGVDTLELDLAVTKDDVLVISHDPNLLPERCLAPGGQKLTVPRLIRSLTWAELSLYDCGALANPLFPEQRAVPGTPLLRLTELFDRVAEKARTRPEAAKVHFNVETKIYPAHPDFTPAPAVFAGQVLRVLKDHAVLGRCTLESFDDRTLKAAKRIQPALQTVLLTSDNHLDYLAVVQASGANILSPDHDWILPEDVQSLHAHGIKVVPWTVNDPQEWEKMIQMGVDGMITDYPNHLLEYLQKTGRSHAAFSLNAATFPVN